MKWTLTQNHLYQCLSFNVTFMSSHKVVLLSNANENFLFLRYSWKFYRIQNFVQGAIVQLFFIIRFNSLMVSVSLFWWKNTSSDLSVSSNHYSRSQSLLVISRIRVDVSPITWLSSKSLPFVLAYVTFLKP